MRAVSRSGRAALLAVSLFAATSAAGLATAVPAHASALSATPDCESAGAGHFRCLVYPSGGTAPYSLQWSNGLNIVIVGSRTSGFIQGYCAVDNYADARLTVTDAAGATLNTDSSFICYRTAP